MADSNLQDRGAASLDVGMVTLDQARDFRAVKRQGQIFPLNKIDAVVRYKQETKRVSGHTLDTPGSLRRKDYMRKRLLSSL